MKEDRLAAWMSGYLKAWESNDPADIGRLFTDDGRYYTAPYRDPWNGRDAIVREWIARKDQPGTYQFRYEPVVATDDVAVVRGWTTYAATPDEGETRYSNLWVIRFAEDGRCSEFIEWWMEHR
jgi:uncharacterized protein (TIGR02246 family)